MERVEQVTSTDSQCVHRDGSTLGKHFWRGLAGLNRRHCRQVKEAELKPFLTPSCLRNYQQEGEKSSFLLNLCLSASHSHQDPLHFQTPYLLFLSRLPPSFSFSLSLGSQQHAAGLRSLLMEGWCNTSQACGTQACKQHLSSVQCSPTSIQPTNQSSPLPSPPPLHGHWEKCRHITLQCFSSLGDSVSTPLPVTSTPYTLTFNVLGCAPLQNPAM